MDKSPLPRHLARLWPTFSVVPRNLERGSCASRIVLERWVGGTMESGVSLSIL